MGLGGWSDYHPILYQKSRLVFQVYIDGILSSKKSLDQDISIGYLFLLARRRQNLASIGKPAKTE